MPHPSWRRSTRASYLVRCAQVPSPVLVCLNIHSASSVASPKAQTSGGHHRRWHSSLLSEDFIEYLLFGVFSGDRQDVLKCCVAHAYCPVICERRYECGVSRWQRGTSSDVTVRRHRWRAVAAAADGDCSRGSAVRCAGKPHTLSVSCLVRLSRPSSYRVVIEMDMGTRREELALVVSDPPMVRDAPAASGVRNLPLADGSSIDDAGSSREPPKTSDDTHNRSQHRNNLTIWCWSLVNSSIDFHWEQRAERLPGRLCVRKHRPVFRGERLRWRRTVEITCLFNLRKLTEGSTAIKWMVCGQRSLLAFTVDVLAGGDVLMSLLSAFLLLTDTKLPSDESSPSTE
ncbi:hypothetical protein HPB51_024580 [Rhipicephalus microplus]|uniref:Uncharacterized protein n=1 Tax=Rhipicephalus microplus TaxID=6941 RepID=A0A9J6DKT5_RHIMP|nr:hypothetical protein HPB51_024580 [Rhipicephalus microplus]